MNDDCYDWSVVFYPVVTEFMTFITVIWPRDHPGVLKLSKHAQYLMADSLVFFLYLDYNLNEYV